MLGGDTALHGYRFDHCGLQFGLVSKGVPDPYIYIYIYINIMRGKRTQLHIPDKPVS